MKFKTLVISGCGHKKVKTYREGMLLTDLYIGSFYKITTELAGWIKWQLNMLGYEAETITQTFTLGGWLAVDAPYPLDYIYDQTPFKTIPNSIYPNLNCDVPLETLIANLSRLIKDVDVIVMLTAADPRVQLTRVMNLLPAEERIPIIDGFIYINKKIGLITGLKPGKIGYTIGWMMMAAKTIWCSKCAVKKCKPKIGAKYSHTYITENPNNDSFMVWLAIQLKRLSEQKEIALNKDLNKNLN